MRLDSIHGYMDCVFFCVFDRSRKESSSQWRTRFVLSHVGRESAFFSSLFSLAVIRLVRLFVECGYHGPHHVELGIVLARFLIGIEIEQFANVLHGHLVVFVR